MTIFFIVASLFVVVTTVRIFQLEARVRRLEQRKPSILPPSPVPRVSGKITRQVGNGLIDLDVNI